MYVFQRDFDGVSNKLQKFGCLLKILPLITFVIHVDVIMTVFIFDQNIDINIIRGRIGVSRELLRKYYE